MNIFFLDKCPKESAQMLIDKHCGSHNEGGKMIIESGQMLANCYTLEHLAMSDCPRTQKGSARRHSYLHHPSSKWVMASLSNFNWLLEHAIYMAEEKEYRGGKEHFTKRFIYWCFNNEPDMVDIGFTKPALAMKQYPQFMDMSSPIRSYHKFYVADKQLDNRGNRMDVYTGRERPKFWYDNIQHAEFPDYV